LAAAQNLLLLVLVVRFQDWLTDFGGHLFLTSKKELGQISRSVLKQVGEASA